MQVNNQRVIMKRRPVGAPKIEDFDFVDEPLREPGRGEVLIRTSHIGLSPAARIRMSGRDSYAPPLEIGETMYAPTVGIVLKSRHPEIAEGEWVTSSGGWQTYSVCPGDDVQKFDVTLASPSSALGVFGTSGFTAWAGLRAAGGAKPGQTVVVAAASGSVGSLVCQIAALGGARVVGIAGGAEKCQRVTDEYRAEASVDYKSATLEQDLNAACPDGVDLYFDNVGGRVRDAVVRHMAQAGRVLVCGLISEYNDSSDASGPPWFPILAKRLRVQGFLLRDHWSLRDQFLGEMAGWVREGRVRYAEEIHEGLSSAPQAFINMLAGRNRGKSIVRLRVD